MIHTIKFEHGYDCITFECSSKSKDCLPGYGGSHGRHGLQIRFISKGDEGAVQFLLLTGWLPQYKKYEFNLNIFATASHYPSPADLGYHSKKPHYDGQKPIDESCEYCDGQPCYYDGSGLNAYDAMYALVNGGDTALWAFLDQYYETVFHDGAYPKPTEFATTIRKVS